MGTSDRTDPAGAAPATWRGWTLGAVAPTTGAVCSDARAGSTSLAPRGATPRRSGSPLRPGACNPSGSRCPPVRRPVVPHFHRPGHRVHVQVVVRHLRDLVPVEPSGIEDRLFQPRRVVAVGDNVEPEAVRPILRDATLVGCQQDRAGRCTKTLYLD